MRVRFLPSLASSLLLAACAAPSPPQPLRGHLNDESAAIARPAPPPEGEQGRPTNSTPSRGDTYSVIVNNVPAHDLLFVLARDARLNLDIHPGLSGSVTLNAIDQTLPELFKRIARQVDMRIEQEGKNLSILPDTPYLKHYAVDYVNLSRSVTGMVSANSQIASGLPGTPGNPGGNVGGNVSNTRIENTSKSQFWESLEKNIKDILRETDKILPQGSSETVLEQSSQQTASGIAALPRSTGRRARQPNAQPPDTLSPNTASQTSGSSTLRRNTFREAAAVIMNIDNGIIAVRATQRQHERIGEFLEHVIHAAHRQVLIESTIVEVTLKDGYEQGIDWSQLSAGGLVEYLGNPLKSAITLKYTRDQNPNALISLLDTFGTTKVLSSPRLSVLNNQTALLKAVENYVYFTVKADTTSTANVGTATTYTTTPQTVSVGLVMGVTPQISDNDMIILNVRPTITSVGKEIADPNPELRKNGIENLVPVIRTREVESVMRVASGNIAVLGGLMEDRIDYQSRRLPLAGQIPLLGELANNRSNQAQKSELVIFLRPVIIKEASLDADYANFRQFLPDEEFFRQPAEARPLSVQPGR